MAKTQRTAVADVLKSLPKTVEIPLTLLRHLVRLSGNRQAKMFLRKATGGTYVTNQPSANVVEPAIAKVEKKERGKVEQKSETAEIVKGKQATDKNFNKS